MRATRTPVHHGMQLRPFILDDLSFFTALARDERVTRYVGDGQPWTDDQIDDRARPALRLDPTDQVGAARWFIGEDAGDPCGLFTATRRDESVEVGYWVAPQHWGRGVAGVMLGLGLAALPGLYGTSRVTARVSEDNIASVKVLVRHGFEDDGRDADLARYVRDHPMPCAAPAAP